MHTASAIPLPYAAPEPEKAAKLVEPVKGSTDPIKPTAVKTVKVKAGDLRALSGGLDTAGKLLPPAKPTHLTTVHTVKVDVPTPPAKPPVKPGALGSIPAKALAAQNSVPEPAI
jgi:hypothetical protein